MFPLSPFPLTGAGRGTNTTDTTSQGSAYYGINVLYPEAHKNGLKKKLRDHREKECAPRDVIGGQNCSTFGRLWTARESSPAFDRVLNLTSYLGNHVW